MKAYVNTREITAILQDVVEERKRQDRLRDAGKFKYTAADPDIPVGAAVSALGEEFGEVCTEALKVMGDVAVEEGEDAAAHLRDELIQVAAVAVAWVEKLDREARERHAPPRRVAAPDQLARPAHAMDVAGHDPSGNRI